MHQRAIFIAILVTGLAGCELKKPEADGIASDTPSAVPADNVATASSTPAVDSAAVVGRPESAAVSTAVAVPGKSDSTPLAVPIVTGAELTELRARLIVPVSNVRRQDLRDTYTEPRTGHTHEALDIPAPRGTPVLSATAGRVLKLHESRAGGLMVYAADPSDHFILLYGHLDSYAQGLKDGMRIQQGQVIGTVGTTGNAPPGTPHLHFAILRGVPSVKWWRGTPVNPFTLLASAP